MNISVTELYEKTQQDPQLAWIDVRTYVEFNDQRPESSSVKNLPLDQLSDIEAPKDQPLYISCLSGKRSQAAQQILKASGYAHVVNVIGGFNAWKAAGLPVNKT
ncbi:MAG: rhodanese-like domain-containing protein [Magnetovibrio sp.]|nr:rhodanese-like domain-containing protein [Magnetovibrio sp.]